MADKTALERLESIVTKLFPWLARFGIAASGALQIKSAAGRTELEGGGPAVARVGDAIEGGWLLFDIGIPSSAGWVKPPILYYSTTSAIGPWTIVGLVAIPGAPPVPPTDIGTHIIGDITSGSAKVQSG